MQKNKIIAIGNAIVDVVCKIDEEFLTKNSLIKGSMSLIDDNMVRKLSDLKIEKTSSGGSAGNTIAAIAQMQNPSDFIGKVASDNFGKKFIAEIEKSGVKFVSTTFSEKKSATSFILVTEDGERTMCTFLGCALEIKEEDILEKYFENASILYLEGYLWDSEAIIKTLKKAISFAKIHNVKIAFTLSDLFCVARHKEDFISLIINDLDILFANENEIKELLGINNIEEKNFTLLQNFFIQNKKLTAAITRSKNGCVIFSDNKIFTISTDKIAKPLDTTGAGDCFAAGFLFGINNNFSLEKSAKLGNLLASKIIQKFGARFEDNEISSLKINKI